MPITHLVLRNFKCFRKTEIDFPKITLLTGANSSGKSSVLLGILATLQSREFPFGLDPNGKYANMGDYPEMVFNSLEDREIGIDIEIIRDDVGNNSQRRFSLKTDWTADVRSHLPKLNRIYADNGLWHFNLKPDNTKSGYRFRIKYKKGAYKASREYELNKLVFSFLDSIEGLQSTRGKKSSTSNAAKNTIKESLTNLSDLSDYHLDNTENLNESLSESGHFGASLALDEAQRIIHQVGNSINYISPFRLQPERTYYRKSEANPRVGKFGENYIEQILDWKTKKAKEFGTLVAVLGDLGLLSSLQTHELSGGRFEVRVRVNSISASLADVGFGISQFLPVLVADLQLPKNSTLIVAQPEIHLHPSVQAELGNYMVKQVNESGKRYIVETHSEYLINRLRLLIARGIIAPSDVGVYYFENFKSGSKTYRIEMTRDGKIEGAPKGFFETYMMDVLDIALNA